MKPELYLSRAEINDVRSPTVRAAIDQPEVDLETIVMELVKATNDVASVSAPAPVSDAEYMYPVWAEENSALGASNTYEWAFGNGANTPNDGGMTIFVPTGWTCTAVAMSLRLGGGTATVELVLNGTLQGARANVVATGQSATDEFASVAIANNDYINFRTTVSAGTSGPCVATVWLRMTKA